MADGGGCISEDKSPAAIRSATNLEDFDEFFARTTVMQRVESIEQLERVASAASAASTINNPTHHGSTFSRCGSSDSWQVLRHVKVIGNPDPLTWERPAGAVLPEWPAVDADVVASSKRHLLTFEIDPTTLPTDVLCHLAMEMFVSAGLPAGLAEDRVRRFILAVRASMIDNPYHNFYHVFDVMQTTNALATSTGTMARLDSWERLALLSAALCHDLEHPGVTSQFLSKVGDSTHGGYKNLIFRDALLEKHHALRALGVMVDRDIGILEGLSSEQYYHFRSTVSKIILATDITRHKEYVAHLQEFEERRAEDPAVEMDKQLAMELMVKCADISNVVKPAVVARRWALRVTDEFFVQGDTERAMGMEVSPNCDRFATSRVAIQIGFIHYLAAPFFDLVAAAFPGLDTPLAHLRSNRASYALCTELDLEKAREGSFSRQHLDADALG
ncbi:hypothetical protein T484DRAFT_1976485 [Baffinella frigidus]|nr:hypothetical protein T484DRAFT_1976485 [Cryptophyta sp. CCMP2293]